MLWRCLFFAVTLILFCTVWYGQRVTVFASTSYVDDTHPTDPTRDRETHLTGTTGERTNITDPGSSDDPEDLKELNIANTVTVTYDNGNGTINGALRILITLTILTFLPLILVMMTSFTRIIIVLHFTRSAIATQTSPPNQVLLGLALILTFFIMQPTITEVYNNAVVPFDDGLLDQQEFLTEAMKPIRTFMYGQTLTKDVRLFMDIDGLDWDGELDSIPNAVLIPSFVISELRTAFIIGFLIFVPFIVIDMVVASVLMSMGMMMLPPTTISLPFKILLFVLADGWNLVIGSVVKTFY
ncbi:MAG: flagellar type III secretion system pore protein FliP [Butyrivibrio sp.]|nr:flagellar type III secretion system pore protein FliP [Butyrivibrio sp.]